MKKSIVYLILAMIIYTIMMTYTLPTIKEETNGIEVFDLRPMGYTVEEGTLILESISDKGLNLYKYVQLPLDFLYPMFLFLFTYNVWCLITKYTRLYSLRWLTISVLLFDYLENIGIYLIFAQKSSMVIKVTSWMSISKAMSTTVVMTFLLVVTIYHLYRYWFMKEKKHA